MMTRPRKTYKSKITGIDDLLFGNKCLEVYMSKLTYFATNSKQLQGKTCNIAPCCRKLKLVTPPELAN